MTPASTITHIGFIFTLRNKNTQITKITTNVHLVSVNTIEAALPQKALIKMEIPAEAIIATTAGRSEPRTPCSIAILRYFKYNLAINVTIIQDGNIQPNVATNAPPKPAILMPTKVAELTAIGPGVICEIVIKSVNSDILSQPRVVTNCP